MAVPKRKTTPSKKGHRRSHDQIVLMGHSICSNCKMDKLPHHICGSCGFYNGRLVVNKMTKVKSTAEEN